MKASWEAYTMSFKLPYDTCTMRPSPTLNFQYNRYDVSNKQQSQGINVVSRKDYMKNSSFIPSGVSFKECSSHTQVKTRQVSFKVWKHITSGKIKLFSLI